MPYQFIFTALIFITLLAPIKSWASYLMNHERFYALSTQEQNQIIIKTMEMATELEAQYPHAKITLSNSSLQKKYSFFFNHIKEIILSNANADSAQVKLFENYGQDFINLTSGDDKKEKCLYAGWVSKLKITKTKEGKEILTCSHPQNLDKNSDEYKAYVKADKRCDANENRISCNPAIFGFQKGSEQSLFCVDAGLVGSADSSIECMKFSLTEHPKDETKVDSKETRLKLMRESLAAKPDLINGVQRFMFKTCFCENNQNSIDKRYMNRVRPHRTCYGLMRTIGESTSCQIDGPSLSNVDDFKMITTNLNQNIQLARYENANYDTFYKDFLSRARKDSKNDVERICSGNLPTPAPSQIEKPQEQSNSPYTCSVTCSETTTSGPLPGLGSDDNTDLKDNDKKDTNVSLLDSKKRYSVSLVDTSKFKVDDPFSAWNQLKFGGSVSRSCEYKVTKKDGDKTIDLKDDEYKKLTETIGSEDKVQIKITADQKEVNCPIEITSKPSATDETDQNECSLSFEISDDNKKVTAKATLSKEIDGEKTYKWENNESETDSAIFDYQENLEVKGSITMQDSKVIACSGKYTKPDSKDDKGPKFEIVPGEVTLTSKKFSVKINDKAEIPNGFIVIWARDEAGQKLDLKKPENETPKEKEKITLASDGDDPKDKDPKDKGPDEEIKGEVGRGLEMTEFRSPLKTFKICAKLMKDGQQIGSDACADVPKIEGAPGQGSGRPNIPFVNPIHNDANWTNDGVY